MTDSSVDTRTIPISGRDITVHKLSDAQFVLMAREAKQVQRDSTDPERRVVAAARLFDILESMLVIEDERDFVLDEIIAGKIELNDLLAGIRAFGDEPAKPKVRRGRPPTKRA